MKLTKPRHQFEAMETLLMGGLVSEAFHEAVRLGLFDLLETPKTAEEVAATLDTHLSATEALLSLLAHTRILRQYAAQYQNTPSASEFLVSSSPFYQGAAIEIHRERHAQVIRSLPDLLKNPGQARINIGKRFASSKAIAGMAQHAVRGSLQDAVRTIAAVPGFSEFRRLCDIGGNHGRYAAALLDLNPGLHATIADLPEVTEIAAAMLAEGAYEGRLSFLPCDLHIDDLPRETYDVVLASHVLQIFAADLDDFIARIADSIVPGGWFVSQNLNVGTRKNRLYTLGTSLMSLLAAGVDHRIPQERLEKALHGAGFRIVSTKDTGTGQINRLIVAQKALH